MVGAVTCRAVAMAVEPVLAWQEAIERGQKVVVGTGSDLDDHHARRRVRHEDRQQPVAVSGCLGDVRDTLGGQVDQAATTARAYDQDPAVYGKMLRNASRIRPRPPPAGADS
jgi:hypothetical protein